MEKFMAMELVKVLVNKNYVYEGKDMEMNMDMEVPMGQMFGDDFNVKVKMNVKIGDIKIRLANDEFEG